MSKPRAKLATVWLDGCSGCHMSFLDTDDRLLQLAPLADLVYSPLVDTKEMPTDVDVTLIEGAVSSEEDYHKIKMVRERTQILVSLGDCAVTANVPGMRNKFDPESIYARAYLENADHNQHVPTEVIPPLREISIPVHQVVPVDVFVPGCPPSADTIFFVLTELLAGRIPDLSDKTRFGI